MKFAIFGESKTFKQCKRTMGNDGRTTTTGGRMPEHDYTISSRGEPAAQVS